VAAAAVSFAGVWKKYRRGERHDSLRDLVPVLAARLMGRRAGGFDDARDFWAVRDVSFEVHPGEAVGIIGPNGAGKSTVLKLLTKILKPTKGLSTVRGRVGALIEVAAGFHPDLTGRENIFLQGAIMGMARGAIAAKLDSIIDFAGVASFIDTPVKRYSSGMNARLGFAIAAHLEPDVLLIDEVLAVGDAAFQQRCLERMRQFRQAGTAIVFVSHDLSAVAHLCQRAVLMSHGAVASSGAAADVIAAYAQAVHAQDTESDVSAATLRVTPVDTAVALAVTSPGQTITFDVEVRFRRTVSQANVGVVVWDLVRNLYIYGISSESLGLGTIAVEADAVVSYRFELDANLTRGLYAVEVNVFEGQERLATLMPSYQFRVEEHATYDGIANLFMRGRACPSVAASAPVNV
jgi:lipopolysaccharide transport system ATP-binding protein